MLQNIGKNIMNVILYYNKLIMFICGIVKHIKMNNLNLHLMHVVY